MGERAPWKYFAPPPWTTYVPPENFFLSRKRSRNLAKVFFWRTLFTETKNAVQIRQRPLLIFFGDHCFLGQNFFQGSLFSGPNLTKTLSFWRLLKNSGFPISS